MPIVGLPIAYEVFGTAKGKRKPRRHLVQEVLLADVLEVDGNATRVDDVSDVACLISGGRFWTPSLDEHGAYIEGAEALTDYAKRQIASWSGSSSPVAPIEMARPLLQPEERLQVPRPADLRSLFKDVEWTDRQVVTERATRSAARLAFFDGILFTDRLEPAVEPDVDWGSRHHTVFVNIDDHQRYSVSGARTLDRMAVDTDAWLAVPPTHGAFADVDWKLDVGIGCAAHLATLIEQKFPAALQGVRRPDILQELPALTAQVVHLLQELPAATAKAFHDLSFVRRSIENRTRFNFGRDDLDHAVEGIRQMTEIRHPDLCWQVNDTMSLVNRALEVLDRFEMAKAATILNVPAEDLAVFGALPNTPGR